MEKEEKKFVNKTEEDEMVMNSVHLYFYREGNTFSWFSLNGAYLRTSVMNCLSLNQFSNLRRLSLITFFGIKKSSLGTGNVFGQSLC